MFGLAAIKTFFGSSNIIIYIIVAAIIGYGYLKIQALESENKQLESQYETVVGQYNTLNKNFDELKSDVKEDLAEQSQINSEVVDVNRRNQERIAELYETFNFSADGSPRDLEKIAKEKAGLLERRVNDATEKVGKEIENATSYRDNADSTDD